MEIYEWVWPVAAPVVMTVLLRLVPHIWRMKTESMPSLYKMYTLLDIKSCPSRTVWVRGAEVFFGTDKVPDPDVFQETVHELKFYAKKGFIRPVIEGSDRLVNISGVHAAYYQITEKGVEYATRAEKTLGLTEQWDYKRRRDFAEAIQSGKFKPM